MKLISWNTIRLVLIFAVIVFLFAFSSKRNAIRKLTKSEVIFVDESNPYIKQETVNKLLIENKTDASSIQKVDLDLNKLEKAINSDPMIEKSEVFVTIDGVLKAIVIQKTPIARVFNESDSFYIDYQGNKMPLSEEFTARVPIISGDINKVNRKEFDNLLRWIYNDDFLKKTIIGIEITAVGGLRMEVRDFSYQLVFGKTVNIERKFKNYKAFFQKAVNDSLLAKYKKVNLTFTQQVVCTK